MLNLKKQLSSLLAATMLVGGVGAGNIISAANYKYADTTAVVEGIEVVKADVGHWLKTYQGAESTIYTTHEAYDGNGAMLIKSNDVGTSFVANNDTKKTDAINSNENRVIEGDKYKFEYYQKPLAVDATGKYILSNSFRYYDSYDVYTSKIYDAETGIEITADTPIEKKWYKLVAEITASAANAGGAVGFAIMVGEKTPALLIDNLKMYHEVGAGNWILMSNGSGVTNGDFEEGVTPVRGTNPTNVIATSGIGEITISWINSHDQQTKIYNGTTLVATVEKGITSKTISGLTNGTEYTYIVKGVANGIESAGVTVKGTPHDGKYFDTIDTIGGVEVFSNTVAKWQKHYQAGGASNHEIYLTHEAYKGSAAMLVKSDTEKVHDVTNVGCVKTGNTNPVDNMVVGDVYKIEYYQKPIVKNTSGQYQLIKQYRYYDNYDVVTAKAYDIERGVEVSTADVIESKWYKIENEFVAKEGDTRGGNGAFAIWASSESPIFLVDEAKMYHKIGGSWVEMSNGTTITNNNFELGVEPFYGIDPTDIKVENKTESAKITWKNPQEQKTKIYDGTTLLATAEKGATSIILKGLVGNKEYNLTIKGVGMQEESVGVGINVFPFAKMADTVDVIEGVEVCKVGANFWLTTQYDTPSDIYTTHESFKGNASLLIVPSKTGNSYPSNYQLSKALPENIDADKIIVGDSYKVVFYQKPISLDANNKYTLANRFRYYNNYDVYSTSVYDAVSGNAISGSDVIESKWYKLEGEFTANAANLDQWVGFAIAVGKNSPAFLLDNLEVYHKVGTEWVLMKDGTGARNGNLEDGMVGDNTAPYEVENFKATAGNTTVTLNWNTVNVPDLAGYTIWEGNTKIADIARNVNNYSISGLTNDMAYTYKIKAYDRNGNSSEGTTVVATPTIPIYETGEYVIGNKIVKGDNIVTVNVKNNKKTEGLNTQLIIGLFDTQTNTLVKATASTVKNVALGASDTLTANLTVDDLNAGVFELRAFLWESLDSVSPLKDCISIAE